MGSLGIGILQAIELTVSQNVGKSDSARVVTYRVSFDLLLYSSQTVCILVLANVGEDSLSGAHFVLVLAKPFLRCQSVSFHFSQVVLTVGEVLSSQSVVVEGPVLRSWVDQLAGVSVSVRSGSLAKRSSSDSLLHEGDGALLESVRNHLELDLLERSSKVRWNFLSPSSAASSGNQLFVRGSVEFI